MSESKKILVVEDNDFVRMQIVRFLQAESYDVIEATDGQKALDNMSADIAMAIVDVRMEPIDGFEFIRAIRGRNLNTPVVLVTGDQNPDLLNESAKWNVAAVLMKPVQKERLIKTVSRTLQPRGRMAT
ncbi:MAG: response regulator [Alphaproteobacteria bacterium]|nr:response regulator [Alphaproteobacteria bacterium]